MRRDAQNLIKKRQFDKALTLLDEALVGHPDNADLLNERGRVLNNLGRLPEAAQSFEQAIAKRTNFAVAHNNLGHVLRALGDMSRAKSAFLEATTLDPKLARAHHNLAGLHAVSGDYESAAASFRRGLSIEPGDVDAYSNLGEVLQFLSRYAEALDTYKRGLAVDPDCAELHANCGALQHSLGDIEAAMTSFHRALELDSGNVVALAGRALLEEIMGSVDVGWSLIEPHITANTDSADILHAAGRLLRRQDRHTEALAMLLPLRERTDWARNPRLYYTLGEIYDELNEYDKAFDNFSKANDLKPGSYDPASHSKHIACISKIFSHDALKGLPHADHRERMPVFILGMPRSGTSLVEQILASHSQVHAGGERLELPLLIEELSTTLGTELGYPDCVTALTHDAVTKLRDTYLDSYGELSPEASRFTDKRPWNFLHIGMIELLFPNARIVHCTRDPLDICVSIYFQNLNARSEPYASDLDHIAAYYCDYQRITKHWSSSSNLPILDLQYETMVENQEEQTRRLLDFLDLEWQPDCLRFFETKRVVNTASYAQVRQPIYKSSVNRHVNYAHHIERIAARLTINSG